MRIIVERNVYYEHHPYLRRNNFTEKDEDDIEHLLVNTRYSLKLNFSQVVCSSNRNFRRRDIEKLYENCEIIQPSKDIYPESLGDMTSSYVSDFREEFLSDLQANGDDDDKIKIIRSIAAEKS